MGTRTRRRGRVISGATQDRIRELTALGWTASQISRELDLQSTEVDPAPGLRTVQRIVQNLPDPPGVEVRTHLGYIQTGEECYFIKVNNLSDTPVVITNVWFDADGEHIYALRSDRPPTARLEPRDPWETFIPVHHLPDYLREQARLFNMARVLLSDGRVLESKRNTDVPPVGIVAGGPITSESTAVATSANRPTEEGVAAPVGAAKKTDFAWLTQAARFTIMSATNATTLGAHCQQCGQPYPVVGHSKPRNEWSHRTSSNRIPAAIAAM
jgi:hypothetical protein